MKYRLICEACGKVQDYDSLDDAFNDGWDYPPHMGEFGVLSPRTCPNCTVDMTVWWKISCLGSDSLTAKDIEVIERIKREPESIIIEKGVLGISAK